MPLILGANTLSAGGYEVDNSLRFNRVVVIIYQELLLALEIEELGLLVHG
jgi:hypothetical protein